MLLIKPQRFLKSLSIQRSLFTSSNPWETSSLMYSHHNNTKWKNLGKMEKVVQGLKVPH